MTLKGNRMTTEPDRGPLVAALRDHFSRSDLMLISADLGAYQPDLIGVTAAGVLWTAVWDAWHVTKNDLTEETS